MEKKSHSTKNNENGLDQFYTNPNIASSCYQKLKNQIDINKYDIHLEPSAGRGAFFNLMDENKKLGIDIDPKQEGILTQDFLSFEPENNRSYLVVGNPPFGRISSTAVKFFNKAAEFADQGLTGPALGAAILSKQIERIAKLLD
mgnify:CR=1 FL=1